MLLDGLWNMIVGKDGKRDPIKYIFHIVTKNKIRAMMEKDPDAEGIAFDILDGLTIDPRVITHESTDPFVINEQFMRAMLDNYDQEWLSYKPGILEKKYKPFVCDFVFGIYRTDSEYTSKIGGTVSRLIVNKEDFADPMGNHIKVLEDTYDFWKNGIKDENGEVITPGEGRERIKPWVDWVFRYIIKHYQKDQFYFMSVNFFLHYLYVNADKWVIIPAFYPENWYGNGRGYQTIGLYGDNF